MTLDVDLGFLLGLVLDGLGWFDFVTHLWQLGGKWDKVGACDRSVPRRHKIKGVYATGRRR